MVNKTKFKRKINRLNVKNKLLIHRPTLFNIGRFATAFTRSVIAAKNTLLIPKYRMQLRLRKPLVVRSKLEFKKKARLINRMRTTLYLKGLFSAANLNLVGARDQLSVEVDPARNLMNVLQANPRKLASFLGKRRGVIGGGLQWWSKAIERLVILTRPKLNLIQKRKRSNILLSAESVNYPNFKKVSFYRIILTRSLNNIFAAGVRISDGEVLELVSAGTVGLSGPKRTSNLAAEKVGNAIATKLLQKGILVADLAIKSPIIDKFIKSAVMGILGAKVRRLFKSGFKQKVYRASLGIRNILLDVGKAHNGIRLPKQRRV